MSQYGYIYKTTNLINGMIYIGQKKGIFNPKYYGSGKIIKSFIKKYGKNNFKLEQVCSALNKEELNVLERSLINDFDCIWPKGYNLSIGGNGGKCWNINPMKGKHHSKETKDKIGRANKNNPRGHPHNDICICICICISCEAKRGNNYMLGKHHTRSIKRKIAKIAIKRGFFAQYNKLRKGKTFEEIYGAQEAKIQQLKRSGKIHKDGCLCASCRSKRGETIKHNDQCNCCFCKSKRGEYIHKINCQCASCKYRKGSTRIHPRTCKCVFCLAKRGEYVHKKYCQCVSCLSKNYKINKVRNEK